MGDAAAKVSVPEADRQALNELIASSNTSTIETLCGRCKN